MIRLLKSVAVGAALFAAVYLLGTFVEADFDIANWGKRSREGVVFFGSAAVLFTFFHLVMEIIHD